MSSKQVSKLDLILSHYVRNNYECKYDQHIPITLRCLMMRFSNKIIPCQLLTIQEDLAFYQLLAANSLKIKKCELLFKASDHNFCTTKFHALCDGKGATITIFKSNHGNIYGGYTSKSWSSSNLTGMVEDSNAFLFVIRSEEEPAQNECPMIFKVRKSDVYCAIFHSDFVGPTFGTDIITYGGCGERKAKESFIQNAYNYGEIFHGKFLCGGNPNDRDRSFKLLDYEVLKLF